MGRFRSDLFYRLNAIPLHLPALRESDDDVLLLADHFLAHFGREYGVTPPPFTPQRRRALLSCSWPGNIRELKNVIERAVLLGEDNLAVSSEASTAGNGAAHHVFAAPGTMEAVQRIAARDAVKRFRGNKSQAAHALGISRKRLYVLLNGVEQLSSATKD
ncbi:MAG: hypothetical protein H0X65_10520 [Gemmatimonadetes bacterium]|nr:hypothetical protein [Gemmatimonadota bacterium]